MNNNKQDYTSILLTSSMVLFVVVINTGHRKLQSTTYRRLSRKCEHDKHERSTR